jgi:hypothetical protein
MTQTIANYGSTGSLFNGINGSTLVADNQDALFLDHTGTNYVYLPGVGANRLSLPDAAAYDITGDIDVRWYGAMDSWTATNGSVLLSRQIDGTNRAFRLVMSTSNPGRPIFTWYPLGTSASETNASCTAAVPFAAGEAGWVRVTLDVNNGAGTPQFEVKFFTGTDGVNWTQLGSTLTGTTGPTSLPDITSGIEIGAQFGSLNPLAGKVFRVQMFASLNETDKRLDIDTSVITSGNTASFTALTGQTVTINRSTSGRKSVAVVSPVWLMGTDDFIQVGNRYLTHTGSNYVYLPFVFGQTNHMRSPDSAALDITGDIDLRVKIEADDWNQGGTGVLVAKYGASGQRSYLMQLAAGRLSLVWSNNGTTENVAQSTVTTLNTTANFTTLWLRGTLDVDNGASGRTITFFTSTDGTNWTQYGDPVVQAGVTSIFNSTALLRTGDQNGGNVFGGKYFRVQVLNGIDGTVAFDANCETSITSFGQETFTESSTNAATVTINRAGTTYRAAGITQPGYLFPGAVNTFTPNNLDATDMDASDSFSVVLIMRQWGNQASFNRFLSKAKNLTRGYSINQLNNTTTVSIYISPDATSIRRDQTIVLGQLSCLVAVVDRSAQTLRIFNNGTATQATTSTSAIGSLRNTFSLRIGSDAFGGSNSDMEFISAAIIRKALSQDEINRITAYYQARLS